MLTQRYETSKEKIKVKLVSENGRVLVILSQALIIFQTELNDPQKSIAHGTVS